MEKKVGVVRSFILGVIATFVVLGGGVGTLSAEESAGDTASTNTTPASVGDSRAVRAQERKDAMTAKKAQAEEQRAEVKQTREEQRTANQEERQEKRSDRAQQHAQRLETHFGFYTERLGKIIAKLETRFIAMKAEGKDVSSAEAKLASAKSALDKAKTMASQAVSAFSAIDPAKYEEQRAQALSARDLALQAREQFRSVNALLKESVALAKSAQ